MEVLIVVFLKTSLRLFTDNCKNDVNHQIRQNMNTSARSGTVWPIDGTYPTFTGALRISNPARMA